MNHKILKLTDRLDNLKFAYALSEARIKQLEARVEELEGDKPTTSNDPASSTAYDDQFLLGDNNE